MEVLKVFAWKFVWSMESPRHIENLKEQYKINFGNRIFANLWKMKIVLSESWTLET